MSGAAPKPAVLSDEELAKVRALEAQLGKDVVLVAYAKPLEPAALTPQQLEQLQQLERELGHVCLVAWRKQPAACP